MDTYKIRLKGGPGSGHHGHKGIPGHRGGSLPADSQQSATADGAFQTNDKGIANLSRLTSVKLTNDLAGVYIKQIAREMEKAGLYPYVSPSFSDSQLGGLNTFASNVQNWTISDGDIKSNIQSAAKPGELKIGVAVKGKSLGLKYYDTSDGYDLNTYDSKLEFLTKKITRLFESMELHPKSVKVAGWDTGAGTYDVSYAITLDKTKLP